MAANDATPLREGIANRREITKWIIGGLGAATTLLLGTGPLSGIGTLELGPRLMFAVSAAGVALLAFGVIFRAAIEVLFVRRMDLADLLNVKDQVAGSDLERVKNSVDEFLSRQNTDLQQLTLSFRAAKQQWLAASQVPGGAPRAAKQSYRDHKAQVQYVLMLAGFEHVALLFRRMVRRMFQLMPVVLLAIMGFSWAANPPKTESKGSGAARYQQTINAPLPSAGLAAVAPAARVEDNPPPALAPTQNVASGIPHWWIGLALGAGVIAVLVFALRKRADGATATGILTLAGSALAYADRVARVDPDTYWHVVLALTGLAVFIGALCLVKIWRTGTQLINAGPSSQASDEAGSKTPESPLVIAVLPVVLLFTFCLVAYGAKKPESSDAAHHPLPVTAPVTEPKPTNISVEQLSPRFLFLKGVPHNPPRSEQEAALDFSSQLTSLESEVVRLDPRPGDQVVLVGMADCIPASGGNDALASRRAHAIEDLLKSYATQHRLNIVSLSVPQGDSCRGKAAQRAVIPFFAHATQLRLNSLHEEGGMERH